MKLSVLLSSLLVLLSLNSNAQKNSDLVEWGSSHSCGSYQVEGIGIYQYQFITASPMSGNAVNFRAYDMNTYELVKSKTFSRKHEGVKLKYDQMLIFGERLLLFATYYAPDGKDHHVLQELNIEFEPIRTIELGSSVRPTKKRKFSKTSNIPDADIELINNEMFYKVNADQTRILLFDKIKAGEWDVKVLNQELEFEDVKRTFIEPTGADKTIQIKEYASHIDANANYVALRSVHNVEYEANSKGEQVIKDYKVNPNAKKYMEFLNMETGVSEKIDIVFEGAPLEAKVRVLADKSMIIAGAYSSDYTTGSRSYLAHGTFVIKLRPDHSVEYIKTKPFENQLTSVLDPAAAAQKANYEIVYVEDVIVYDSEDIVILMEREQALRTAKGYARSRKEIIIVNCKKDGEIQSEFIIDKFQNTGGVGGLDASSFKAEKFGNTVYLVFNSGGKSVAPNLGSKDPYFKKQMTVDMVKVTSDNGFEQRELYAYPSTYSSIVSPSSSFLMNEKEFFLFCKNIKRSSAKVARVFIQNVFQ